MGERVLAIRERIERTCLDAGRSPSEVTLIGASKRQSVEGMLEAWEAGLRIFGENRVQEARDKQDRLPSEAEWHLIGPLQSNKARLAVELFGTVHSVDREKIARALDREAGKQNRKIDVFLEVNLGEEESKHGFPPDRLLAAAERVVGLPNLSVVGLMAIPPFSEDVEATRSWFRELRELRDRVFALPALDGRPGFLSMGMSNDFEIAVSEGATHVRVGTALFGARPEAGGTTGEGGAE